MREISAEELGKHTTRGDCWVALHGKVYDVTDWLDDHPGGLEVILDAAGKDATKEFDEVGHSDYAIKLREKYALGAVQGASPVEREIDASRDPWEVKTPAAKRKEVPASDDSGAFLGAIGVATAALALAVYLIRS